MPPRLIYFSRLTFSLLKNDGSNFLMSRVQEKQGMLHNGCINHKNACVGSRKAA
jgi:hypothetical protein